MQILWFDKLLWKGGVCLTIGPLGLHYLCVPWDVIHAAPAMYHAFYYLRYDDMIHLKISPWIQREITWWDLPYHKKELTSYETSCSVRWCNATKKQILFVKAWVWLEIMYLCAYMYVRVCTYVWTGFVFTWPLFEGAKYERISMYVHIVAQA